MRHIISALVRNKPGVLARVSGLFSARGFNIESLAVGQTEDPNVSRMTVVVPGDDAILEQVRKQLSKLVDTIKVQDFEESTSVLRDLMLIKVKVTQSNRSELIDIVNVFRGKIVDMTPNGVIIEITGEEGRLDRFLNMLRPYGIVETMRTGRIAMARNES